MVMNSQGNITNMLAIIVLIFGSAILVSPNVLKERTTPVSSGETEELMENFASKCNLPNITFIDLFDYSLGEKIIQDTRCAITCMLKELGLITDKNQYNEKAVQHLIRLLPESIDSDEDVECDEEEFGKECSEISELYECDTGWVLFKCLLEVCNPRKNVRIIEKYV